MTRLRTACDVAPYCPCWATAWRKSVMVQSLEDKYFVDKINLQTAESASIVACWHSVDADRLVRHRIVQMVPCRGLALYGLYHADASGFLPERSWACSVWPLA